MRGQEPKWIIIDEGVTQIRSRFFTRRTFTHSVTFTRKQALAVGRGLVSFAVLGFSTGWLDKWDSSNAFCQPSGDADEKVRQTERTNSEKWYLPFQNDPLNWRGKVDRIYIYVYSSIFILQGFLSAADFLHSKFFNLGEFLYQKNESHFIFFFG